MIMRHFGVVFLLINTKVFLFQREREREYTVKKITISLW